MSSREGGGGAAEAVHAVAIVGGGPRGLYSLERLLAELHARPLRRRVHVHVFDRTPHFGASPVYDPDQPDYILTNSSVADLDVWDVDDPPPAAGRGPHFVDWHAQTCAPSRPLPRDAYIPRALAGRYLMAAFRRVCEHVPEGVALTCHAAEVVDGSREAGRYRLAFRTAAGEDRRVTVDQVLLATGHSRVMPGPEAQRYQAFAARHRGTAFVPFVYPVRAALADVPAGSRVAMKGLGLTFIDAVLALTEGRGGRFVRAPGGGLRYQRSGDEPAVVYPFSRTGLPMTPKAVDRSEHPRPLVFLTPEAVDGLRRRAAGGRLGLADLWPLVAHDLERAYYLVAMDADARTRLLACGPDADAQRRLLDAFHQVHPHHPRFDYRRALDPAPADALGSGQAYTAFVARYLDDEMARARRGQAGSPTKAALDLWYELRSALGACLTAGCLTADAHRQLLEHHFPRFKRVAFGPPLVNIEKLRALVEAGLLDFSVARAPRLVPEEADGRFHLRCRATGAAAQATVLIDARYPPIDLPRDATSLYRNLLRRGLVRPYENPSDAPGASGYRPGAIDLAEGTCWVVDARGRVDPGVAVLGIPTEGHRVGNFTLAREAEQGAWAAAVVARLRQREASPRARPAEARASCAPPGAFKP